MGSAAGPEPSVGPGTGVRPGIWPGTCVDSVRGFGPSTGVGPMRARPGRGSRFGSHFPPAGFGPGKGLPPASPSHAGGSLGRHGCMTLLVRGIALPKRKIAHSGLTAVSFARSLPKTPSWPSTAGGSCRGSSTFTPIPERHNPAIPSRRLSFVGTWPTMRKPACCRSARREPPVRDGRRGGGMADQGGLARQRRAGGGILDGPFLARAARAGRRRDPVAYDTDPTVDPRVPPASEPGHHGRPGHPVRSPGAGHDVAPGCPRRRPLRFPPHPARGALTGRNGASVGRENEGR